jgi:hypothetical protein
MWLYRLLVRSIELVVTQIDHQSEYFWHVYPRRVRIAIVLPKDTGELRQEPRVFLGMSIAL